MKDTIHQVLDSLQQHPILKGVLPTAAGVGVSFIDHLEAWMRLGGLGIGILIGLVTLVVKTREAIAQHKRLRDD